MNSRLRVVCTVAFFLPMSLSAQAPKSALPDFAKAREEAVKTLQDLVRIDTSNPPGNETKVAEYLKSQLEKEGIAAEIVALDPARGNLIARIKGNGKKKPRRFRCLGIRRSAGIRAG